MSLTHAKNNVWTCESCNCKTNPVRAVECAICGTAAPKTKFGRKAHGSYVLVSLNNAKRRAFARVFDLRTDTVLTEELPAAEELDDRVAVALRTALDAGYQAKVRHEKHRRHSTAQTLAKRVHREREAEESRARVTGDLFAQVAAGVEIGRRAGTSGPRFRVLSLGHIDLADLSTNRWLSSSSQSTNDARASKLSRARPRTSGRSFEFRAGQPLILVRVRVVRRLSFRKARARERGGEEARAVDGLPAVDHEARDADESAVRAAAGDDRALPAGGEGLLDQITHDPGERFLAARRTLPLAAAAPLKGQLGRRRLRPGEGAAQHRARLPGRRGRALQAFDVAQVADVLDLAARAAAHFTAISRCTSAG